MPNPGCNALVLTPASPLSPLLFSSSLPLNRSNVNGFYKAEALGFFFPNHLRRTVQVGVIQGCGDAAEITNIDGAGFPGQTGSCRQCLFLWM